MNDVVEKSGPEKGNKEGGHLVECCIYHNLIITNTRVD